MVKSKKFDLWSCPVDFKYPNKADYTKVAELIYKFIFE